MNNQEEKLVTAVDSLSTDILDFVSRLVAQDSTLGNEGAALQVMEDELCRLGQIPTQITIEPETLSMHPGFAPVPWTYDGRYNVVATRPADGVGGKSALFNGHLDVVSPEPLELWTQDPFDPIEKDGWLYGRGAGDMKAGVAAMTYAVKAIEVAGMGLNAPVTIETVIEEECTGNGALACLLAGYDADAVLIPEPFGPTILASQVGVCWFKVSLLGKSNHALETKAGVNSIEMCYPIFHALRELEKDLNRRKHEAFQYIDHPINLNIGVIKGGEWPSSVPAKTEFDCRLAFFPGTTYQEIQERIRGVIKQAAKADPWLRRVPPKVTFYGFRSEGHSIPADLPGFKVLANCHQDLSGKTTKQFVSTATTDLRTFVQFGKGQATCFGPVAENIHAADERVNIASIVHTAKVYTLFMARWCGLKD